LNAELDSGALTVPPAPESFWQAVQWQARSSVTGWEMV
jgi:hypothetical protein